jgi:uncharacterized membrane protein
MLAPTCVGWLLFFIHHMSQAISVNHIVDKIGKETEATICELMPSPRGVDSLRHAESVRPNPSEGAIPSEESGYIRFIDTQRLIVLAKQYHVTTQVEHSVDLEEIRLVAHAATRTKLLDWCRES